MTLVVGPTHLGTREAAWASCARLAACPPLDMPSSLARVVVLAPHPDDEVLGVGGWLHELARAGCAIDLVAITDGEASHAGRAAELPEIRARERRAALDRLGVSARLTRLGEPDGAVGEIAAQLADLAAGASLVLATWERDGHPDHDATGAAAIAACAAAGVPLLAYPIWAWHWARPDTDDLPWSRARRIPLPPAARRAKVAAIAEYRSQIEPLDGVTIVPPAVRARFERPYEIVFLA